MPAKEAFKDLQKLLAKQKHTSIRWLIVLVIALVSVVRVIDLNQSHGFDAQSYDQLVKRRLWGPDVDQQIIIVDIDERSLEKMRGEFGRWPWPRETLAGVLEWLNQQGAKAIVFDILFADPDTLNPASDLAFVEAVRNSSNTFFPVLRLNPKNDALSQVTADQLQGFTSRTIDDSKPAPSLAVVPPVFDALVQSGRMGFHNIYADKDGMHRMYRLWEDKDGWRIWSLPARLAQELNWPLPSQPEQLIHYTLEKDAYTKVGFSDIWELSQSQKGQQKDPRFQGAIVLIGSTATSLFDVKATPIDTTHPGVMILANVIDNLKHQSFLQTASSFIQLLVAWLGLGVVVWASTRIREDQIKWGAAIAPTIFLGIGFASLQSLGNRYWDLTQSASNALLFFSFWAIYLNWRTRLFGKLTHDESAHTEEPNKTAVLKIDFSKTDIHVVFNDLSSIDSLIAVVRIGSTGQPAYEGIGLVHVTFQAIDRNLSAQIDALPCQPMDTYVNETASCTLNCEQYWGRIWSDIYLAEQKWSSRHEK
jgi:adenylate cyclase